MILAYVAAYTWSVGIVLGAIVLIATFHLTGARWPQEFMPSLSRIVAATPLLIVLFVPIALTQRTLYPPHPWNETRFFLVRAAAYLVTWSAFARLLRRTSDPRRLRRVSAAAILAIAFTGTFATFDWVMALEEGFTSTVFGLYRLTGGFCSAVGLVALLSVRSARPGENVHALGRLLLMAVVLWAYLAFFQLLIIWIADVPRESAFFAERSRGAYGAAAFILGAGHFALPFLALLSHSLKMRPRFVAAIGGWLVVMDALEAAWLVLPAKGLAP